MQSIIKRLAASLSTFGASLRSIACIIAAVTLLASCENKTPEVGYSLGLPINIKLVNNTERAAMKVTLIDNTGLQLSFNVTPGKTREYDRTVLASQLNNQVLDQGLRVRIQAFDYDTHTNYDLPIQHIGRINKDHPDHVITLSGSNGNYSVRYTTPRP